MHLPTLGPTVLDLLGFYVEKMIPNAGGVGSK